jgi:hypothetical protein
MISSDCTNAGISLQNWHKVLHNHKTTKYTKLTQMDISKRKYATHLRKLSDRIFYRPEIVKMFSLNIKLR